MACFSKVDGEVFEEEIDSILGFLRYDYPEAIYADLRQQFRQALAEHFDLGSLAQTLADTMPVDRKIMLGVQLYDLISRAGLKQEQVVAYYSFMSQLGMAAQAIDIVYQLNANEDADPSIFARGASPLESLCLGADERVDVHLRTLQEGQRLLVFRYHDLILLRNLARQTLTVRGRPLLHGTFCRLYPGDNVVVGDVVLSHSDFVYYFNAKKNVALHQVYLSFSDDHEVCLERHRSRDTLLEVRFGLKVRVKVLNDVAGSLGKERLKAGRELTADLSDRLTFDIGTELVLYDLRRRARALGGRFQLKTTKVNYRVSNNPSLLQEDDILLSPGLSGEVLLQIDCDYEQRIGHLEVLQASRPILVRGSPVRNTATLFDGDVIRIDNTQVLRCDFTERILTEERNIIRRLVVKDLASTFPNGELALDGISFSVQRGEMVCVMGSSGSGKSTLLRAIAGRFRPKTGGVLLNGQSLYDNLEQLKSYIAFVPQEDSFDESLTIEENLDYAAAIRSPHLTSRDRGRRIENRMIELGLQERRNSIVGTPYRKNLSGGERKRLNIGLDMIGSADLYLVDEPTSGLSSRDSEQVIDILRNLAQSKIVIAVIHQPSAKLFHQFNKAMLLDKGGRLVFFGTPQEMAFYFAQTELDEQAHDFDLVDHGLPRPDFIFDVLETPLRDLSGEIVYEENSAGQRIPARRYSPTFWRDKFESYRLLQDVQGDSEVNETEEPAPTPTPPRHEPMRWRNEWTRFATQLSRAFRSKLRNKANFWITMVEAPALALLIAGVLRYSETGDYTFASAFHLPTYLFLSLLVAMFLGLTNSADDIIRDRLILQRERNLTARFGYYVIAKLLALAVFAGVQCGLFLYLGNLILELRGMFWIHFSFMFLTALCGVCIGLFVSALSPDSKSAANIVPLVLIPQIMLAGALIKYEEMNRNFDLAYAMDRLLQRGDDAPESSRSDLEVPFLCEFIPTRWAYEAMVVAQAKLNPLNRRQGAIQRELQSLVSRETLTQEEVQRLDLLKVALARVSGAEGQEERAVFAELARLDRALRTNELDRTHRVESGPTRVTAEQLYVNQKIMDLVVNAEIEEADYRGGSGRVFFGPTKQYWGLPLNLYVFNALVLTLFCLVFLVAVHLALWRQFRMSTA